MQCVVEGNLCAFLFNHIDHKNKLLFHEQIQCVVQGNIYELPCNHIGHNNHEWSWFMLTIFKKNICPGLPRPSFGNENENNLSL